MSRSLERINYILYGIIVYLLCAVLSNKAQQIICQISQNSEYTFILTLLNNQHTVIRYNTSQNRIIVNTVLLIYGFIKDGIICRS